MLFLYSISDSNRKTSVDSSSSSSSYSDIEFSDNFDEISQQGNIILNQNDADCEDLVKHILELKQQIRITLKLHVTETTFSVWDTILNPENNILYVSLPSVLMPEASKQSFITLLEFAEEKLEADAVVLCMRKDRLDRPNLVRTFLFLGFQPLSTKSPLAPPPEFGENNLFLIYNINED